MDTPSHGFPAPRALEAVAAFVVYGPRRLVDRHMQGFVFEEYWLASKAWERHGLTTGAARSLVHNGFLTLDDLQGAHDPELATISRIGRKSLAVLYGLMGGEVPSNDGRRPGRQTGPVYGQPTWQRPARQGSARLVVSRIVMAGYFGLPLPAVPRSTLRRQPQPQLPVNGGSHSLLSQASERSGPAQMHPLLCGAALVDAVIGITPSERYSTRGQVITIKQRPCSLRTLSIQLMTHVEARALK